MIRGKLRRNVPDAVFGFNEGSVVNVRSSVILLCMYIYVTVTGEIYISHISKYWKLLLKEYLVIFNGTF